MNNGIYNIIYYNSLFWLGQLSGQQDSSLSVKKRSVLHSQSWGTWGHLRVGIWMYMSGAYKYNRRIDLIVIRIKLVAEVIGVFNIIIGRRLWMKLQHLSGTIYMVSPKRKLRKHSERFHEWAVSQKPRDDSYEKAYTLSEKTRKTGPQVCGWYWWTRRWY